MKTEISRLHLVDTKIKKLRRFNLIMGFLHFVQGVFMIIVTFIIDTPGETYPVYSNYLTFNRDLGGLVANPQKIFDIPLGHWCCDFPAVISGSALWPGHFWFQVVREGTQEGNEPGALLRIRA